MSYVAIALYLLACASQWRGLQLAASGGIRLGSPVSVFGLAAVLIHGVAAFTGIVADAGLHLSLLPMVSVISWFVSGLAVINAFRHAAPSIMLMVFGTAIAVLLIGVIAGPDAVPPRQVPAGLFAHVLLSVLAYSVLTIAALHAVMLSLQESRLREHRFGGMLNSLPPLQTMEATLFELLTIGFALLTLAIGAGALYIEDFFAQHLAHKTFFSIAAWAMFGALLLGRWRYGWRAGTAVRWTLWGFGFLLLAYVGSQWVLQYVLAPGQNVTATL